MAIDPYEFQEHMILQYHRLRMKGGGHDPGQFTEVYPNRFHTQCQKCGLGMGVIWEHPYSNLEELAEFMVQDYFEMEELSQ